ncbi:hypothetical protein M0804_014615 [Polistes exclamans]|nr:hypothetical protein M0804_014618 [Polistes exclamans]KAI4474893.1 hypothetical protein M0804_014615 [Polistes exclamans]
MYVGDQILGYTYLSLRPTKHTCNTCGNEYIYFSSLIRHIRDECGQEPKHRCPYCPKKTKLRCNLLKHIRKKHVYE